MAKPELTNAQKPDTKTVEWNWAPPGRSKAFRAETQEDLDRQIEEFKMKAFNFG